MAEEWMGVGPDTPTAHAGNSSCPPTSGNCPRSLPPAPAPSSPWPMTGSCRNTKAQRVYSTWDDMERPSSLPGTAGRAELLASPSAQSAVLASVQGDFPRTTPPNPSACNSPSQNLSGTRLKTGKLGRRRFCQDLDVLGMATVTFDTRRLCG